MEILVPKYQPVEIVIPASFTGTEIAIPNQASLYNKRMVGMEVYARSYLTKSPITYRNTVDDADLSLMMLEFFTGSDQICKRIPVQKLNRLGVNGVGAFQNDYLPVDNWEVSWDKCNLIISDASLLTDNTGVVLTIGVYYYDLPKGVNRPM